LVSEFVQVWEGREVRGVLQRQSERIIHGILLNMIDKQVIFSGLRSTWI
jgi:hypothetical protein